MFDLAVEAQRVINAELATLPGSRLVEMSVGPAHETQDYHQSALSGARRQWTAECRAVLARG